MSPEFMLQTKNFTKKVVGARRPGTGWKGLFFYGKPDPSGEERKIAGEGLLPDRHIPGP